MEFADFLRAVFALALTLGLVGLAAVALRRFGPEVAAADGSLNRAALAKKVFGNPAERAALNAMVHPPVLERLRAWKEQVRRLQQKAVAIIPLLYEVGAETGWDAVICIGASKPIVLERLQKRGLSRLEAEGWLAAQWPVEEKMKRADYPVWNDGSLRELDEKISILWKDFFEEEGERTTWLK